MKEMMTEYGMSLFYLTVGTIMCGWMIWLIGMVG